MPVSKQQLIDKAAASLLAYEAAPSAAVARTVWWDAAEAHLLAGATDVEILTRAVLLGREAVQGSTSVPVAPASDPQARRHSLSAPDTPSDLP